MTPEDTAPVEWRPSHRRSEDTGKVLDHWHREDSKHGVTMPEVYSMDDVPEPISGDFARLAKLCVPIAVLEDGRNKTMPCRLAAWKYVTGISGLTMREAAEEAGCELKTFFDSVRKIQQLLRGNP